MVRTDPPALCCRLPLGFSVSNMESALSGLAITCRDGLVRYRHSQSSSHCGLVEFPCQEEPGYRMPFFNVYWNARIDSRS